MAKNKILYGLSQVHYALYTEGADGTIGTWGTPKPIPGAVSFSPTASGSENKFFADNGVYFSYTQDNGDEGDIEMAKFPEEFLVDILSWIIDENKVLIEAANVPQNPFALLFQVEGNSGPLRVVYYHCTGAKPNKTYATAEETVSPSGETMHIIASTLNFGEVTTAKASVFKDDNPEIFEDYFKTVTPPKIGATHLTP